MRALATLPALVSAHGNTLWPPAWWDAGAKVTVDPGQACAANCGGKCVGTEACQWFTDFSKTKDNPGLPAGTQETNAVANDDPMRTYYDIPMYGGDLWHMHPWRHPGKAPIAGPCGVGGGNPNGCPFDPARPNLPCKTPGDARGFSFPDVPVTTWRAGSVVETAWQLTANHGGGYAYRLCPKPVTGNKDLTEACFNAGHLDFVGDKQWFQFGHNRSSRALYGDVQAVRTTAGTFPEGSMWTRNPIPACAGPGSNNAAGRGGGDQNQYPNKGGAPSCSKDAFKGSENEGKFEGTQFEPAGGWPGPYADHGIFAYGFGNNQGQNTGGPFLFNVIDLLQVPKDLKPGMYVLSNRYDCEQTPQSWSTCADIKIVAADSTEPDGALIPDGPFLPPGTTGFPGLPAPVKMDRYHCPTATAAAKKCVLAAEGHSTMEQCVAACK